MTVSNLRQRADLLRNYEADFDGANVFDLMAASIESLQAEVEKLRGALTEIGTDCRYFANDERCSVRGRLGTPVDRENWCGGCVVLDALGVSS